MFHELWLCSPLFPSAPVSRPTPFSAAVSSESKRSGCPINLFNLCRMRAKCQQTKSQVAERPHNLIPSGSTTSPPATRRPTPTLATPWLPSKTHVVCISKLSSPNGKLQNAKHKTRMRRRRAKASADSCAIQSCCRLPSRVVVVVVTVTSLDLFNCRFLSHFN